jgi:hypothetical protein
MNRINILITMKHLIIISAFLFLGLEASYSQNLSKSQGPFKSL